MALLRAKIVMVSHLSIIIWLVVVVVVVWNVDEVQGGEIGRKWFVLNFHVDPLTIYTKGLASVKSFVIEYIGEEPTRASPTVSGFTAY